MKAEQTLVVDSLLRGHSLDDVQRVFGLTWPELEGAIDAARAELLEHWSRAYSKAYPTPPSSGPPISSERFQEILHEKLGALTAETVIAPNRLLGRIRKNH